MPKRIQLAIDARITANDSYCSKLTKGNFLVKLKLNLSFIQLVLPCL